MDLFLGIIPAKIPSELRCTLAWPIIIYSGAYFMSLRQPHLLQGKWIVYLKRLYDNNKNDCLDLSLLYEIDVQHLSEMIRQVLSEPSVSSHISFPSQ